jgi:hypothetical protein
MFANTKAFSARESHTPRRHLAAHAHPRPTTAM